MPKLRKIGSKTTWLDRQQQLVIWEKQAEPEIDLWKTHAEQVGSTNERVLALNATQIRIKDENNRRDECSRRIT